jgi:hypothetical protein
MIPKVRQALSGKETGKPCKTQDEIQEEMLNYKAPRVLYML